MSPIVEHQTDIEASQNKLNALEVKNAHKLYPARFYHIESLLNRSANCNDTIKVILLDKANIAIAELATLAATTKPLDEPPQVKPSPLIELTQSLQQKSSKAVKREIMSNFDNLLQQQETSVFQATDAEESQQDNLSVVEAYRDTISQMNTKKFIQQVINEVPKDPGPLNAHKLVITTLTAMQGISPSYLRRVVNQIDTMFYLNQAAAASAKKAASK